MNKIQMLLILPVALCFSLTCTKAHAQDMRLSFRHIHQSIPERPEKIADEFLKRMEVPSASCVAACSAFLPKNPLFPFNTGSKPPLLNHEPPESARAPPINSRC